MSILHVLLDGELVATLNDAAGAGMASLQYTDSCLGTWPAGAPLLSARLPVTDTAYPGVHTRPWLEGLLPEGDVRAALAARAKLDSADLVGLLRAYGRDCAGAVTVVDPAGAPDPTATVRWLTDEELAVAIRELPRAPFGLAVSGKIRVSLGGVQGKLAVVVADDGKVGVPEGLQPSTHVLKPAPLLATGEERYPGIVTAEAMCLKFCQHVGLATPDVQIRELETGPALLVARYDRVRVDGELRRLHQEDLCQALGVSSVNKYQKPLLDGTPSLEGLIGVLRQYGAATLTTLRDVLARATVNALLTNCDAHGKNWSLMLPGTTVRLAPVYDVVPSTLWPTMDTELAMYVAGCAELSMLTAEQLLEEAQRWSLGRRAAGSVLTRVRNETEAALTRAAEDVVALGGSEQVAGDVHRIVHGQLKQLFRAY